MSAPNKLDGATTMPDEQIRAIAEDCSAKDGHLDVIAFANDLLSASKPAVVREEIAMRNFDAPHAPVKWPHEITVGHIKCLIEDHQRDGKKQLDRGLTSSGSYLIRVAESFRWCLEQLAASPAAPAQSTGAVPLPEATRNAMGAALSVPALSRESVPVEVWRGERKVTIYDDCVLRVWGTNIESEMSDAPRTLQTVQDALDWLYAAPQPAQISIPTEIIEARKAMLVRMLEVQAMDRQSGGTMLYDHEVAGCRARIFMAIDAEIERADRVAVQTGDA